jgi:hypothetical protein
MAVDRREFLKLAAAGALAPSLQDTPPARARLDRVLKQRGVPWSFKIVTRISSGVPESFTLAGDRNSLHATGGDARGLSYALYEIADRVERAADPMQALHFPQPVSERPVNSVRSVARLFTSDVTDKAWFNDREMWPAYFEMLASQRFNRFQLAFGIGYDFLREVTDAYFVFAYPFLVSPSGYKVRAVGLPDAERDSNLAMLKYISDQAAEHGLDFQLGLWTHGYQWENSPHPNYTIEGVTPENHAQYSRDALTAVLRACPGISGITLRIHGESGVAEGNYGFWKTVFDGVARVGRKVELDLHSKGIDQQMIDNALATGMTVRVSPKFWAEHMGLPYHQADIRPLEIPPARPDSKGLMALSTGSRSFTRYGYADLLRNDRRYSVIYRIWSGTQRVLLWGDPVFAAAYSRAFQFCGSSGVDIMEPLSFKGRRGSGVAGSRCGYADASLAPRWDWQKYLYTYRVWGRALYNPDSATAPLTDAEAALASASRILPLITTAHGPSAANNNYWPEMYTNQSIVDPKQKNSYSDTPSPKVFGNVSPFDPQLFSTVNGFAGEVLKGERSGKYSPIEVAQWLTDFATTALDRLAKAESAKPTAEFRRLAVDVKIQAGLGQFFAEKFRSAVMFEIHEHTGDAAAMGEALAAYDRARDAWAKLAKVAEGVYVADLTLGEHSWLRGHWSDRLAAIDEDIAAMRRMSPLTKLPIRAPSIGYMPPPRRAIEVRHVPSVSRTIEVEVPGVKLSTARLYYRHVTQAQRWESLEMQAEGSRYRAEIPAGYAASPYPLQYYFELRAGGPASGEAWLYPGLGPDLTHQPYFVVTTT